MCCAASCAAPCAMLSLLGAKDPLMHKLVPVLVREMGRAYPELLRAEALIAETLKLEETRFRKTLERGLACSTTHRAISSGAVFSGDDRLQALRHLWLPARPDAGCTARPRHHGRHGRLQRRHAAPEGRGARPGPARARLPPKPSGSELKEKLGATEFLGYDTETAEGVVLALVKEGKLKSSSLGHEGRDRGRAQPDPVLRRVRRPDGRYRRSFDRRGRQSSTVTDTQKKLGEACSCMVHRRRRHAEAVGDAVALDRRSRPPLAPARQPFGDPSPA